MSIAYDMRNWKPRTATIYDESIGIAVRECRFKVEGPLAVMPFHEEMIEC
jgi:hypothetical protein